MSTELTIEEADAFLKDYAELCMKHGVRLTSTSHPDLSMLGRLPPFNAVVAKRNPDRQFSLEFVMEVPEAATWRAVQRLTEDE